jgi:hypothetical protein
VLREYVGLVDSTRATQEICFAIIAGIFPSLQTVLIHEESEEPLLDTTDLRTVCAERGISYLSKCFPGRSPLNPIVPPTEGLPQDTSETEIYAFAPDPAAHGHNDSEAASASEAYSNSE